MIRTVKSPDVRRAEILQTARRLFQAQGYANTSVDEIVRDAQVAKGTFYYYFKSKEAVLAALAHQLVMDMVAQAHPIVADASLGAVEKLCRIIASQNRLASEEQATVDDLHRPENQILHQQSNIETVRLLGPVLAAVVEQGNREGVFQVQDPLSTVQFILAGSLFLLGHGIFHWLPQEQQNRTVAMVALIERAFGARPGALSGLLSGTV